MKTGKAHEPVKREGPKVSTRLRSASTCVLPGSNRKSPNLWQSDERETAIRS